MNYITQIPRYTSQGISLIILAFSLTGLLGVNNGINTTKSDSSPSSKYSPTPVENKGSDILMSDERESIFLADGDTVVVSSEGTDLSYDVTEIRAKAGSTLTIRYENTSDMPHNIVFVNSRDDIQPVGVAGIRARDNDYVPQDEENQARIFASTKLAKPGDTVFVTFTVPEPGTYPYICTYPGHFTMMQGDLISEE